jgi:hypothetical protein
VGHLAQVGRLLLLRLLVNMLSPLVLRLWLLPQLALPPALRLGCLHLLITLLSLLVQLLLMVSPLHKLRVLHLLLQVQAPPHQIYLQESPHHPALVCIMCV